MYLCFTILTNADNIPHQFDFLCAMAIKDPEHFIVFCKEK